MDATVPGLRLKFEQIEDFNIGTLALRCQVECTKCPFNSSFQAHCGAFCYLLDQTVNIFCELYLT